ncbi:MAG: VOC family protein [Sphingomonadaceae bacterium]|nr:VOC family protein [Sphingomonadaceae bacterium]
MAKMIFVNLPVADLAASTAFYKAVGFVQNERFSGPHATMMAWSDTISVMLTTHEFYATLVAKPIADARAVSACAFALSFDSRAEVDAISEAAVAAGGRELHGAEDEGFMYSRAFEDLDGHSWGPLWMDIAAAASQPESA